jgi:hypothetical protein
MVFYAAFFATLLAAALLAGCDNPSAPSTGDETQDSGTETTDTGGNLVLTGADGNNVIYKDREPSRLELRVSGEGWENLNWHLDGRSVADWKDQAAITIHAADYPEARHTLALSATRSGIPYSTTLPLTVTRERATVVWTQTTDDSSFTTFDLATWEGDEGPTETWSLSVIEQSVVYFAVRKPSNALITVKGVSGGAQVDKAKPGETLDGSFADSILDIFTVQPSGDALFGEGECRFSLVVSEPDRQDKTVKVTLAVRPKLTGVAIFHRQADGNLARITIENAAEHANPLYAEHTTGGFPAWGLDFAHVENLYTALKWLDNYARGGTAHAWAEYLVRVEADEQMPKTMVSCHLNGFTPLASYIRIRIRGYGGERRLTHDPTNRDKGNIDKGSVMFAHEAFLSIGPQDSSSYVPNDLAVHLENNITIDAGGGTNQYFPNQMADPYIASMVAVSRGNTLVMEAGSKLTNYTYTPPSTRYYYNTAVSVLPGGVFAWRGGEISNIVGPKPGNIVFCHESSDVPTGAFDYHGAGVMSGNTGDNVAIGSYDNPNLYPVTDSRFAPP